LYRCFFQPIVEPINAMTGRQTQRQRGIAESNAEVELTGDRPQ
jgi:hypothetical protein